MTTRRIDIGIPPTRKNELYAVERPDGRLSSFVFSSPFRAAEHAMKAAKCSYWPELFHAGVRVVPVEIDAEYMGERG